MNLDKIQSFWLLLTGIATGIGGLYTWLKLSKVTINKDISEGRKQTKVNDVEGDEAIVRQIDSLLNQISIMSESMLKDKIELSNSKYKEIRYKDALERIKHNCDDCKLTIDKVLSDLKLD